MISGMTGFFKTVAGGFFAVCRKYNVVPANACVQFAMTPRGIVSILLNTSNRGRVKSNVESVECHIHAEF